MAATVPVESEGGTSAIVEEAMMVGLTQQERDKRKGESAAPAQSVNEPKVGSFESFMSSFGSPGRWAGR